MKAYSTDLREKLVLAYESGDGTLDEVADTFGVGRCTVARMMKLRRAGQSLAPLPHGGGYPAMLDEKLLALLVSQVATQPDATLFELAAHLKKKAHVEVHLSTVCQALQKLGLPRKKKPRGFRKGRSRPASLSSQSRPLGSSPFCLYRRNGLSSGDDQSLWTCGARSESQPKRAAQSGQGK
jgi:transposase